MFKVENRKPIENKGALEEQTGTKLRAKLKHSFNILIINKISYFSNVISISH